MPSKWKLPATGSFEKTRFLMENDVVNTQIRNVAIVGTGLIGASWAALYLASGFDVIATDPAPNAEADLRKRVDEAWELLTVIGLAPGASRDLTRIQRRERPHQWIGRELLQRQRRPRPPPELVGMRCAQR